VFLTSAEVTLGVGILTAGSAIGATWLTSRRDRKNRELELEQERRRWEREDALSREVREQENRIRREQWQREDRDRWAERRLQAHTVFLGASREVLGGLLYTRYHGGQIPEAFPDELEKTREGAASLEPLSTSLTRKPAAELMDLLESSVSESRRFSTQLRTTGEASPVALDNSIQAAWDARWAYLLAVHREVGLEDDEEPLDPKIW
jgi:hypothetical protein